jgi:hypothetical protein
MEMSRGRVGTLLLGPKDPAQGITAQSALTSTLIFLVPMVVLLADDVLWGALLLVPAAVFARMTVRAARAGNYGSLSKPR